MTSILKFLMGAVLVVHTSTSLAQKSPQFDRTRNTNSSSCAFLSSDIKPVETLFSLEWQAIKICSNDFFTLYSLQSKTPLVTVQKLSALNLADFLKVRPQRFPIIPDPRIKTQAKPQVSDLTKNNFKPLQLVPSWDSSSPESMRQTFYMTNILAVQPVLYLNEIPKVEQLIRDFASSEDGNSYAFSGPLFEGEPRLMGVTKIMWPSYIFKVVINPNNKKSRAWIFSNTTGAVEEVSYAEFVKRSGLDFMKSP